MTGQGRTGTTRRSWLAGIVCLVLGLPLFAPKGVAAGPDGAEEVILLMRAVADWQLAQVGWDSRVGWKQGVLLAGVMALHRTTLDEAYREAAEHWAQKHAWQLGPDRRSTEDQCAGQAYVELYLEEPDPHRIRDTREVFDHLVANPRPGRDDWYMSDALFMAPPVLTRLYAATGDSAYLAHLNLLYWDATDHLRDPTDGLFRRDVRYFGARTPNGKKLFWSRGNGWVLAGLARILQYLPASYAFRRDYVELYRDMSARIADLQHEDGGWRSSLLDPDHHPSPESSGTALFCYALAWGVNEGLLDREVYAPVIMTAWLALSQAVHDDGRLGWVQPPSRGPGRATSEDTAIYGAGAFLLAGSEIVTHLRRRGWGEKDRWE